MREVRLIYQHDTESSAGFSVHKQRVRTWIHATNTGSVYQHRNTRSLARGSF